MNIGDKLKQTRKKGGFTQDEISQQIHVSRQTISSWENSKSLPDVTSLILL
ncbi:helix-turn-helix transcriptional regulator, partial [Listeria monocytogenes]|nr:helix-turn-helix transcriptional regulator [Listeria monocytogenes]